MARTGKNKQNANYYIIAANGFIKEYKNEEETIDEEKTDTLSKKLRGDTEGIVKPVNNQRHLVDLEYQCNRIKNTHLIIYNVLIGKLR